MKFADTVKHSSPDLPISKRHDAWLAANDHPVYSQQALDFAQDELTKILQQIDVQVG